MNFKPRLSSLLLALVAAFVLAGCVNAAGASLSASAIIFLIALLGLGIAACTNDTPGNDDGWQVGEDADRDMGPDDVDDVADVRDIRDEREGTWVSCCQDGEVSTCFCPADSSCNYGWYEDCGDGTCTWDPAGCTDTADAGDTGDTSDSGDADVSDVDASDVSDSGPDADGRWEPCCIDGVVDTCFCPSGAACNYGWFTYCDNETCSVDPAGCDEPDAGM